MLNVRTIVDPASQVTFSMSAIVWAVVGIIVLCLGVLIWSWMSGVSNRLDKAETACVGLGKEILQVRADCVSREDIARLETKFDNRFNAQDTKLDGIYNLLLARAPHGP